MIQFQFLVRNEQKKYITQILEGIGIYPSTYVMVTPYNAKEEFEYFPKTKTKPTTKQQKVMKDVLESICLYKQQNYSLVKSMSRKKEYVYCRNLFMWIMTKKYENYNLNVIGNFLSNRDHSTIMHGRDEIQSSFTGTLKHTKANKKVRADIKDILSILNNE